MDWLCVGADFKVVRYLGIVSVSDRPLFSRALTAGGANTLYAHKNMRRSPSPMVLNLRVAIFIEAGV